MKTTLKYIMLVLAVTIPSTAFAGLLGILPPAVFLYSAAAIPGFAIVGLMGIALNDDGRRLPITVRATVAPMAPARPAAPARRSRAYGIRRRGCAVA